MSLFDRIREAAAAVAQSARYVHIDSRAADSLAASLTEATREPALLDPAHHHLGSDAETLAFVFTLDAINFGSGWFPGLCKRDGASGYLTIAGALRDHFEAHGPWSAAELQRIDAATVTDVLGQQRAAAPVRELMEHFARALRDLGGLLQARHSGSFERLRAAAGASAEQLVEELARMPLYRDVSRHRVARREPAAGSTAADGVIDVPLYKRAQITASDLAAAFGERGPGHFDDLESLTLFADNLVPHVLRCEGVLVYAPVLENRIEAGELIGPGSPEEVEIRAVAVHAVERMVDRLRRDGVPGASARRLDGVLWNRGQSPHIKARPRHRTRSVFY